MGIYWLHGEELCHTFLKSDSMESHNFEGKNSGKTWTIYVVQGGTEARMTID